jgi:hypothetical protein
MHVFDISGHSHLIGGTVLVIRGKINFGLYISKN